MNFNESELLARGYVKAGNEWVKSSRRPAEAMPSVSADAEPIEKDLHDKIIAECKKRGFKYVHSRMDKAATIGEGVCDFILFANNGRVLCIEVKSKTGKLSLEQCAFMAWLEKLGHKVFVIRSFREFIKIAEEGESYKCQECGAYHLKKGINE